MSGPPPDDLKDWSKNALVRELRRLRAVLREHANSVKGDARETSVSDDAIVDVTQDPHGQGGTLFDARGAILLGEIDVLLMDTKTEDEPVKMLLSLGGRINYSHDEVKTMYLFGADGAAAITSQIMALAVRANASGTRDGVTFGQDFKVLLERRMNEMP